MPEHLSLTVVELLVTLMITAIGSSGFWVFITKLTEKKGLSNRLLLGLAHDRIIFLGLQYIRRGSVSQDEYENLCEYLYQPYKEMGGNGSAKRIMAEVDKLPIVDKPLIHGTGEKK